MKLFRTRSIFGLAICALAFVSIAAQASGVDVSGFVAAHRDVFAGLAMLGFAGEVTQVTPEQIKEKLDQISGSVKEKTDELLARVREVEQKQDRGGSGDGTTGGDAETMSALVAVDEGFKMVQTARIKSTQIKLPTTSLHRKAALTSTTGAAALNAQRLAGFVVPAQRKLTIRDLVPNLRTDAGSIEYVRESASTNGAAVAAEGSVKGESSVTMELVTANVVTIATWLQASKQILADSAQLQNYLDNRLRYMVQFAEELQLLKGSGVGNNLLGLYTAATAYAAPITITSPNRMDVLRLAIGQLEDANYNANGIVLHPDDWTAIELLKNDDGDYLKADPSSANPRTLWGRPVVTTTAMTVDTFLVGDFATAATLYDREDLVLDIATQDQDDFIRNLVKLRMEERVSLAVQLPGAMVKGDLTPA
ncbi:phage major capsid protein [Variovorax sp.]|uniref:phage major capsid protein n=1 Tax=Variovorax sp. TaxID=1871043 RepID=UPI003BAB073B